MKNRKVGVKLPDAGTPLSVDGMEIRPVGVAVKAGLIVGVKLIVGVGELVGVKLAEGEAVKEGRSSASTVKNPDFGGVVGKGGVVGEG